MESFSWDVLSDFRALDKRVHRHLVDVYRTLFVGVGCASVGVYADYTGLTARFLPMFNGGGFASLLASMALLAWLSSVPVTPSNAGKREGIFYAFAGLQGLSLGTLISLFYYIDPSIVLTAVVGTAVVFACFTASALIAQDRRYIMLLGLLSSGVSVLFWLGLANMFLMSDFVLSVQLYLGLLVFSGLLLADTQLIVQKAMLGSSDHVGHALQLFTDVVGIFVRLLLIIARNRQNDEERRRRRK